MSGPTCSSAYLLKPISLERLSSRIKRSLLASYIAYILLNTSKEQNFLGGGGMPPDPLVAKCVLLCYFHAYAANGFSTFYLLAEVQYTASWPLKRKREKNLRASRGNGLSTLDLLPTPLVCSYQFTSFPGLHAAFGCTKGRFYVLQATKSWAGPNVVSGITRVPAQFCMETESAGDL